MITLHGPSATSMLAALKQAIVKNLIGKQDPEVAPGCYYLDYDHANPVILHVRGTVKRGGNTFAKPTCKLPVLDILAMAIHKAGVMGPHILNLIREAAAEAQGSGKKITDYLETTKAAVRQVQDELIAGMTLVEKAGAFTGVVQIDVISPKAMAIQT